MKYKIVAKMLYSNLLIKMYLKCQSFSFKKINPHGYEIVFLVINL